MNKIHELKEIGYLKGNIEKILIKDITLISQYFNNIIEINDVDLKDTFGDKNVFFTDCGKVKQIQNLHKSEWLCVEYLNCDAKISISKLLHNICTDLGIESIDLLNNQVFAKPPNYNQTSPHQDNAYFQNVSDDIFTVWIPLQDTTVDSSCMCYIKKDGIDLLEHEPSKERTTRNRSGVVGKPLYLPSYNNHDLYDVIENKKGEYLIHDKNTIHYTTANKSDKYRLAMTFIIKVLKYKNNG